MFPFDDVIMRGFVGFAIVRAIRWPVAGQTTPWTPSFIPTPDYFQTGWGYFLCVDLVPVRLYNGSFASLNMRSFFKPKPYHIWYKYRAKHRIFLLFISLTTMVLHFIITQYKTNIRQIIHVLLKDRLMILIHVWGFLWFSPAAGFVHLPDGHMTQ